jgi:T4 RnlA family RNA ligase
MNLETLHKYQSDGLLYSQTHPTLPLTIWNYSEKVQYEGLWDEVTLQCRGLVTDDNGNVVARPFPKFFNYEEVINKNVIPWDDFYVHIQDKMDGSLGILFSYKGEWILATRGSFTSEQSQRGMEILKSKYDLDKFEKGFTYLCEIIYPENRIVVNYNEEKIVFLSIITPEGELNWTTAKAFFHSSGIEENDIVDSVMATFTKETFDDYKQLNIPNEEGFVIRFYPSNFRMKIKFEEYVRLHKIMTNLSTTSVWEVLSNGNSMDDLLKDVPDEFYEKIKSYVKDLRYGFMSIQEHAGKLFDTYYESTDGLTNVNKKDFACWVLKQQKHIQPILFNMWDKKKYDHIIWRLLKPEFRKL